MKIFPEVDELEFSQRHALVDFMILGRLLVQLKFRNPGIFVEGWDTARYNFPAGNAQATSGKPGNPADDDLNKNHDQAGHEPDFDRAGNIKVVRKSHDEKLLNSVALFR